MSNREFSIDGIRGNADPGALGTEAQKYTYQEFPQHSVVKTDRTTGVKYWDFCQQGFALSHVAFVKPSIGEQFYLCLLLMVTRGPTSFPALKEWSPHSQQIHATSMLLCSPWSP